MLASVYFVKSTTLQPLARKRAVDPFMGGNMLRDRCGGGVLWLSTFQGGRIEGFHCTNHVKVCKYARK